MFTFIKFEIKRNFKRKEVIILSCLLIFCELVLIINLNNRSQTEDVFNESNFWWRTPYVFTNENIPSEKLELLNKDILQATQLTNQFDYFKSQRKWNDMYLAGLKRWSLDAQIESKAYFIPEEKKYFRYKDEMENIISKYGSKFFKDYEDILILPTGQTYSYAQHWCFYFNKLYENNLAPLSYSQIDSATVFLQLVRNLFSILLPIFIALLFFNDRFFLHQHGLDKSMMTIFSVRKKYIYWKTLSNFFTTLIILLFPIILYMIVFGVTQGFQNFNYPILTNIDGIFSLNFIPNDLENALRQGYEMYYGPIMVHDLLRFHPSTTYIPLWVTNFLILLMLTLSCLFYVQLNISCTYFFKNPYIALTVNTLIIVLLIILSPITSVNMWNMLNPLAYRDPSVNLSGTNYFPYFAGIIVLVLYNIILYLSNKICFKKNFYK